MNAQYNELHHEMHHESSQEWQEMNEAMHEAYEIQETEAAQEMEQETVSSQRIVTPAVIIRITLSPSKGEAIFSSPRAIVGATTTKVRRAPLTGQAYVPIRLSNPSNNQVVGQGAVYVPKKGSNVVQMATWARSGSNPVQQAGKWLTTQVQQSPTLRRRLRRVQVLVDGKPCQHCLQKLTANVRTIAPPQSKLQVRYMPTAVSQGRKRVPSVQSRAQRPLAQNGVATSSAKPRVQRPVAQNAVATSPIKPRVSRSVAQQRAATSTIKPTAQRPVSTTATAVKPKPITTTMPQKAVKKAGDNNAPRSVLGQVLKEVGI